MALDLYLEQTQKLIMTQAMQQSLRFLQLPALELRSYLQEIALSNPLIDMENFAETMPEGLETDGIDLYKDLPVERREQLIWEVKNSAQDMAAYVSHQESYTEYLNSQLGQMSLLDSAGLSRSRYLVGCLNSAGYLDCALEKLAQEAGQSLFDMEQALFVVQALDPVGTGARSLSECLLLQLAQSNQFSEVNIHLVRFGLPLLAENDMEGLAQLLQVSYEEALQAAETIRGLNPIPSRGFYTEGRVSYVVPEAKVIVQGQRAIVEMDSQILPQVTLNREYCTLLEQTKQKDVQLYLREKHAEASSLLHHLEHRADTLYRVIEAIVTEQQPYFLHHQSLCPMAMGELAAHLGVSVSTVSRAVKDKYIQFEGEVLPLRSFFSATLPTTDGNSVSPQTVQKHIQKFISAELPNMPLSDEALRQALAGIGVVISRRTVAKYRAELGIPSARERKECT